MHLSPFPRVRECACVRPRIVGLSGDGASKRREREFKFRPRKDSITVRENPPGNKQAAVASRSAARCSRHDAASLFYFTSGEGSRISNRIHRYHRVPLNRARLTSSHEMFLVLV